MRDILEPIASGIWNVLAKLCLYVQSTFNTTWLIVLGIAFLVGAIIAAYLHDDKERGSSWITILSAILLFLSIFFVVFLMAWNEFKPYNDVASDINWISVSVFLVLAVLLLISTAFSYRVIYSILYIVCMVASAILLSKFMVVIGVLLGLGAIGGGYTYVGTFTDRNGNSYDVYKKS
jgi:uncharacterized membrane protein YhdT